MRTWLPLPVLVACVVAAPAFAAPTVEVVLEPSALLVGQTGTLHVLVVSEGSQQVQVARGATPKLQVPGGLDVRYRARSSRFSASGSGIVSITSFQYALDALQVGTFTVGPVEVRLEDGSTARSNTTELEVKARSDGPDGGADVAITAGMNVDAAWEGQLVVYEYELESSLQGVRAAWRLPEFEGLRQPQYGQPVEQTYRVLDGDSTITTVKGSVPLLATGTGTLDIPPAIATVDIPTGRQGFRGWGSLRQERRATDATQLVVRPLPAPPLDFSGIVGEVTLRAALEGRKAAAGESLGLVIGVESDGSLEGLALPSYDADGVSVYDDEERITGRIDESGYRGVAKIRRVLVPTEAGDLELPPVRLVTFSPKQGRYVTHEVDMGTVEVTPGREGDGTVQSFAAEPTAVEEVEQVKLRGPWGWGMTWTPRLYLALPLLLLGASGPGGMVIFGHGLAAVRRRYRAWTEQDQGPATAFSHLRGLPDDDAGRLRAYDAALQQALANRMQVSVARLDREAAIATLPPDVAKDVRSLQRGLDSVRYGDLPVPAQIDDVVRRVVAAVESA